MFFIPTIPPPVPAKPITVWVHGTKSRAFTPSGISKTFTDNERLAMHACPGLNPAGSLDRKFYTPGMASILCQSDSSMFDFDNFYLFGWSGELDVKERKRSGAQLYWQLKGTIRDYQKKYNQTPPVTIITHSHGGNVALHMADAYKKDTDQITIDRLILLACPVQAHTAMHTNSTLFKQVYSLHSHADMLQRIDPQKLHNIGHALSCAWKDRSFKPFKKWWLASKKTRFFSERHFQPHEHIKQVHIRWKNLKPWSKEDCAIFGSYNTIATSIGKTLNPFDDRCMLHIEFILPTFMRQLAQVIKTVDSISTPLDPNNPDITITL